MDSGFVKILALVIIALVIAAMVPILIIANFIVNNGITRWGIMGGMICLLITGLCNVISGDMIMITDVILSCYWSYFSYKYAKNWAPNPKSANLVHHETEISAV